MNRTLVIAAVLSLLCVSLAKADNVVTSHVRLAALTTTEQPKVTPRPAIRSACSARQYRCDNNNDCCSGSCYKGDNAGGTCE
jgi:hypothetical protein